MTKKAKLQANEAYAVGNMIRTSPRKLNLVAGLIRGLPVNEAVDQLTVSPKRIAKEVKSVLLSAISNAENNHMLDIDNLVVYEASVGKALVMKRFTPRARGRASGIKKPFSRLRIVVAEKE